MIDEKILFLTHTDCNIPELKKHGLGIGPNLDHDAFFVQPLRQVFSEVMVYDLWKKYAKIGVKNSNKEILNIVFEHRPKYLLWPSMMYEIMESTFQKIRNQGTLVVGWFFDDEIRFDNYSKYWIPFLDYCFTNFKDSIPKYEKYGIPVMHMVLGANPDVFKKIIDVDLEYDVTFVGRKFGQKGIWIKDISTNDISVQMFGRGWPNGYLTTEEMVKTFNASKINLNFSESYNQQYGPQIKNRLFEVCMAGGFLLCEYTPGIEDYFIIDNEIVCFKSIDEAILKIKYYLNHEVERKLIAHRGWERAQADYTQTANLNKAFQEVRKVSNCPQHEKTDDRQFLNVPPHIQHLRSSYHFAWAKGLMIEKFSEKRWQEELDLALLYDSNNVKARQLRLIGSMPGFLRRFLISIWSISKKVRQVANSFSTL